MIGIGIVIGIFIGTFLGVALMALFQARGNDE